MHVKANRPVALYLGLWPDSVPSGDPSASPGRPPVIGCGDDRMEHERPRTLPWNVPDYHERQAARLRELAATATTGPVKARLLHEAEEHEQIARGEPVLA